MPAQPLWPADGLALQISAAIGGNAGEQFRTNAVGYTGVAGTAGLGWDVNFGTSTAALGSGNRAWSVGLFVAQDTLRAFADNPAVFTSSPPAPAGTGTGANPNFGYASYWPDPTRGDAVGFFLESEAPPGTQVFLAFDFGPLNPVPFVGVDGKISLNLTTLVIAPLPPISTVAPPSGSGSRATIGPFSIVGLQGVFGDGHVQAVTIDASTLGLPFLRATTVDTVDF